MADLSRSRRRIVTTLIVLGVLDVAALGYLAWPLRSGAAQPAQVQHEAEEEYRQLSRTTVPLRGIDHKLTQAQKDDAAFIGNRLPSRYSDVVAELGKIAGENQIIISTGAYKTAADKLPGIEDLEIHAGLSGQYVNLVKFINALERDKMFFILDSVGLTEQTGQRAGEVHLDVKLETYLRSAGE